PRQPAAPTNKKTTPWVVTFNCRQWANLIVASQSASHLLEHHLEIGNRNDFAPDVPIIFTCGMTRIIIS
ncbi:MAG: hypothetical protein SGI71_07475, partial [Verrucomicrobiota bacterium]|nr:hypothetical protein [Verrucomicrobiota bacterium]